mgnify:CR=1 FL=1
MIMHTLITDQDFPIPGAGAGVTAHTILMVAGVMPLTTDILLIMADTGVVTGVMAAVIGPVTTMDTGMVIIMVDTGVAEVATTLVMSIAIIMEVEDTDPTHMETIGVPIQEVVD